MQAAGGGAAATLATLPSSCGAFCGTSRNRCYPQDVLLTCLAAHKSSNRLIGVRYDNPLALDVSVVL